MPPPLLPEYVPQDTDLFIERSNLNGLILAGVAYGILFTIVVQCVLLVWKTAQAGGKRQAPWLTYYTVIMFSLATIGFGANTKFIQMTYIDYRNYPGGPNVFTQVFYSHPINMTSFVSYVLMSWLADGLVLYRFSLLYNFRWWIITLPCLVYLGVIAMSTGLIIAIRAPGGDFWTEKALNFGISYWSLSIGLNIGLTLLIAGRLFAMRSKIQEVLGRQHSTPYISVMSMLVESAALYSIWGLVFIILYATHSPVQNIVLPPLGQVQGIAPLLIIFRVGQGKAWDRNTVTGTRANTSNIIIKSPISGSRTAVHQNSFPLSDVSSKVSIQVGKSTIVTTDDDVSQWVDRKGRP